MDTGESLLRGILINPADDHARLVYADWLDEHGQPERARYIRLQIAWARLPKCEKDLSGKLCPCEACALQRDFAPIGEQYGGEWSEIPARNLGQLARVPAVKPKLYFGRGFVGAVWALVSEFRKWARPVFRTHPIELVRLFRSTGRELVGNRLLPVWFGATGNREPNDSQTLPADLFELIATGNQYPFYVERHGRRFIAFDSEEDALQALSEACVAYGRSLAGLPPLQQG
jgi:uncharacterized protein (TIGR02996 family)